MNKIDLESSFNIPIQIKYHNKINFVNLKTSNDSLNLLLKTVAIATAIFSLIWISFYFIKKIRFAPNKSIPPETNKQNENLLNKISKKVPQILNPQESPNTDPLLKEKDSTRLKKEDPCMIKEEVTNGFDQAKDLNKIQDQSKAFNTSLMGLKDEAVKFKIIIDPPPQNDEIQIIEKSKDTTVQTLSIKTMNKAKGISLDKQQLEEIQEILTKMIHEKIGFDNLIGVKFINNKSVFTIDKYVGLVFRLAECWSDSTLRQRYENALQAKTLCTDYHLDHLVVPDIQLFSLPVLKGPGNLVNYDWLVQEKMDIIDIEDPNDHFLSQYGTKLDLVTRQFVQFIALSNFDQVSPSNNPILREPAADGSYSMALLDLEHMGINNSSKYGIIGYLNEDVEFAYGLIGCVSKNQFDIIKEECVKNAIAIPDFMKVEFDGSRNRFEEIERIKSIKRFYRDKNITRISVFALNDSQLSDLCLDPKEKCEKGSKKITLKMYAEVLINHLRSEMTSISRCGVDSIILSRKVEINRLTDIIGQASSDFLKLPYDKDNVPTVEDYNDKTKKYWIVQVLNALKDQEHIFDFTIIQPNASEGPKFIIQA